MAISTLKATLKLKGSFDYFSGQSVGDFLIIPAIFTEDRFLALITSQNISGKWNLAGHLHSLFDLPDIGLIESEGIQVFLNRNNLLYFADGLSSRSLIFRPVPWLKSAKIKLYSVALLDAPPVNNNQDNFQILPVLQFL